MKKVLWACCFLIIILLVHNCYYDSEEFLYPQTGNNCDTTNVTFSASVVPVLQNYCLSCHSNATAAALGGNTRLQDYADVKARADDGKLLGSISHAQGYIAMPQGAGKLSDCTISLIRIWIDNGAVND
jgi:hypothetical protein